MNKQCLVTLLSLISLSALSFEPCFDFGNGGKEPAGAARYYEIVGNGKDLRLAPQTKETQQKKANVFRLIVEDVRFSTYKCWDKDGNITGFDAEMLTDAAKRAGYDHIEFIPRKWFTNGEGQLSLLADLNNNEGDAVSAGMSINEERQKVATMIGPIYKAGKKFIARKDNPNINEEKLQAMTNALRSGNYEALRGLSVVEQDGASNIRGEFFQLLAKNHPDLVHFMEIDPETGLVKPVSEEIRKNKFLVLEVQEMATLNEFIESRMSKKVAGHLFDIIMVDTGTTTSLIAEGHLGIDTHIVSENLSDDPKLGHVFGTGDGVSFRHDDIVRQEKFEHALGAMAREGKIDALVDKWFQDDNGADHSWAFKLLNKSGGESCQKLIKAFLQPK